VIVSEFLTKTNYALRGIDDDAPTFGGDEANHWLDVLNSKIQELYQDVTKSWNDTWKATAPNEVGAVATASTTDLTGTGTFFTDYQVGDKITVSGETERTIATIVSDTSLTVSVAFTNTASAKTFTRKIIVQTGVETYSLNRTFLTPSDSVYVLSGTTKRYSSFKHAPERSEYVRNVFIAGVNPQTITFTDEIAATDSIVGGELVVPGYYMPAELTAETDLLPLSDPNWGVIAVAAEIAFGDITYEDRATALNDKANYLYKLMASKNRRGTYGNPRTTPYSLKRIPDTRR
jgi:hypothetical protein